MPEEPGLERNKALDHNAPARRAEVHLDLWLEQTYYKETLKMFAKVWDLYIKFYTVFMTFNVVGLGFASRIPIQSRLPLVAAFVIQNLLSVGTSFTIARYSKQTHDKLSRVATHLVSPHANVAKEVRGSPVPIPLAPWGGYANCIAGLCLIVCWIVVSQIPLTNIPS
jgi:hypothetical protein